MGKRKLHGHTYYQCDWTALLMKQSNCYMPSWSTNNKLLKKGSYCNWESVLAHAEHLKNKQELSDEEYERIQDYISDKMGGVTKKAPHFTNLDHFNMEGTCNLTPFEFHKACCYQSNELFAVKINETGHSFEIMLDTNNGKIDYDDQIRRPPMVSPNASPACFKSYRKGNSKDREICIFYYPEKNGLELNTLASSLFKMQIFGEVLIILCTKECSFMPRERYVSFTLNDFNDTFMRKRKRQVDQSTTFIKPSEYKEIKSEMELSLCDYEKQASSLARLPLTLAKAAPMPPMNGKQLARLKKHENPVPVPCA